MSFGYEKVVAHKLGPSSTCSHTMTMTTNNMVCMSLLRVYVLCIDFVRRMQFNKFRYRIVSNALKSRIPKKLLQQNEYSFSIQIGYQVEERLK